MHIGVGRTWWEALPELLGLLWVVEGESVEVAGAPNLELGLQLAAGDPWCDLLYPCLCVPRTSSSSNYTIEYVHS